MIRITRSIRKATKRRPVEPKTRPGATSVCTGAAIAVQATVAAAEEGSRTAAATRAASTNRRPVAAAA